MNEKLIYIFTFFILILFQNGFSQDSIVPKSFYYTQFNSEQDIKILQDSLNFKGYIVFKLSQSSKDTNTIVVSIYFINEISQIENLGNGFYFSSFNYYVYSDSYWSVNPKEKYFELVNSGRENSLEDSVKYFDRIDKMKINCSLFEGATPWRFRSNLSNNYFIFKTNLDGILIKDKIKYKHHGKVKKVKVLIPFIRYLPLFKVRDSEISNYHFLGKSKFTLCK
ncbi:MAG: hypothetical protein JST55_11545 [Bacteroidetes bacterium]|nr:hypothetical protein [Bacteroidota bacterium]